jgi:hypothetical protein
LDENLNARSTIKKIFGGSLFQKSHPSPSDRITIAKKNIPMLFILTSTLFYKK